MTVPRSLLVGLKREVFLPLLEEREEKGEFMRSSQQSYLSSLATAEGAEGLSPLSCLFIPKSKLRMREKGKEGERSPA